MRKLKNMTITVEEDVAKWARLEAARQDTSVSRLVGRIIKEKMVGGGEYDRAMKSYLSRPPVRVRKGTKLPRREELYDRPRLR
jgi:hypothetical protein